MFEQFFKSQVAAVSDPYQCNRITDALASCWNQILLQNQRCQSAEYVRSGKNWIFRHKTEVCHRDICGQRKCGHGTTYCT